MTALEPTTLVALARPVFDRLISQLPQVSLAMARGLAGRLAQVDRERGGTSASRATRAPEPVDRARPTAMPHALPKPCAARPTCTTPMLDATEAMAAPPR